MSDRYRNVIHRSRAWQAQIDEMEARRVRVEEAERLAAELRNDPETSTARLERLARTSAGPDGDWKRRVTR